MIGRNGDLGQNVALSVVWVLERGLVDIKIEMLKRSAQKVKRDFFNEVFMLKFYFDLGDPNPPTLTQTEDCRSEKGCGGDITPEPISTGPRRPSNPRCRMTPWSEFSK